MNSELQVPLTPLSYNNLTIIRFCCKSVFQKATETDISLVALPFVGSGLYLCHTPIGTFFKDIESGPRS